MIYKAAPSDIEDVVCLAASLWPGHDEAGLREEFLDLLRDDACAVYIAKTDGEKIGFAQVQLRHDYVEGTDSTPVGYLEGIFVREAWRKHGYARKLLACCEKWAKEKGCFEFASDCELKNDVSLAFHLRAGFSEVNRVICFAKRI